MRNFGTLKKAATVIMAREHGDVHMIDRKMFNFLLSRSARNLATEKIHKIPVQDVLDYTGHTTTARLHESLDRLGRVKIDISYRDEEGNDHVVVAHFLSFDLSCTVNGMLHYAFDPILLKFLHEPAVFAVINMNSLRSFRGTYAAKLYEIAALYEKRFSPTWIVGIDEFRQIMGILDDQYTRFDNLKRVVIDKAIEEINSVAEFDILFEPVRGGRGGKVVSLKFSVVPKAQGYIGIQPDAAMSPIGRSRGTRRDNQTPDLMDGLTDAERGSSFILKPETLRVAATKIGESRNLQIYEDTWRVAMSGRRIMDPDTSFLRWLDLEMQKEVDVDLSDINSETFAQLLDDMIQ